MNRLGVRPLFLLLLALVTSSGAALLLAQEGQPPPVEDQDVLEPITRTRRFVWGGWADLLYQDTTWDAEDARSYLGVTHFYLHGNYKVNAQWRVFGELELENEPELNGEREQEFVLERLFVEYKHSGAFRFRLGKFNTHAGIVKPLHWNITLDTIRSPIMESNDYIPAKSIGLEMLGSKVLGAAEWQYTVALSIGDDWIKHSASDEAYKGAGLDLNYNYAGRWRVGSSLWYYNDHNEDDLGLRAWQPYAEAKLLNNRITLRTEILWLEGVAEGYERLQAYYAKIKYQWSPEIYTNYRFEEGDDIEDAEGQVRRVHTFTFAYRPHNHWRTKVEVARNQFPDSSERAFTYWGVWMGYVF